MRPHSIKLAIFIGLSLVCVAAGSGGQQPNTDEQQVHQLLEQWLETRNARDTTRMQPLFHESADQVNLATGESRDLQGMLKWFDDAFRGSGKDVVVRASRQDVRILSADTAILDFVAEFVGSGERATGMSRITFVCVRRAGDWKVAAVRYAPAKG